MNLLFRIVYAAHASGTHHKLALDALRHLEAEHAELWQRLFLVHAKPYLHGAKAPDTEFKDFKNHVLHTRDGYWGGAPEKVRSWFVQLVQALAQKDWPTAAYSAGVLSHYYTDPLHPFHTGQSEAENNIHRAVEWSISKAYDSLAQQGEIEFADLAVDMPTGPDWLTELVRVGALLANSRYEKLIAHYDIQRGVVDPPAGLDRVSRRLVAQLLRYATLSFAAVLDHAIAQANVRPLEVSLAAATATAMAQVPFKLIARRIASAEERRAIERMYDELVATGTVETHLPEDDRMVRNLHAAEVLTAKRPLQSGVSGGVPFVPHDRAPASGVDSLPAAAATDAKPSNVVPLRPVAPAAAGLMAQLDALTIAPLAPRQAKADPERKGAAAERRCTLTLDDDVVDGPAIGPRTAERLYTHGIRTVRDLLGAEPAALAGMLDARHITSGTIADWQDEARLVCTVPGLIGTHAQLLVGAGYRSAAELAGAEADKLCADVLAYAASAPGQRLLRNGEAPDIERIKGWLEAAQDVKAA